MLALPAMGLRYAEPCTRRLSTTTFLSRAERHSGLPMRLRTTALLATAAAATSIALLAGCARELPLPLPR